MKKKICIRHDANRIAERQVNQIPVRHIPAPFLAILKTGIVPVFALPDVTSLLVVECQFYQEEWRKSHSR